MVHHFLNREFVLSPKGFGTCPQIRGGTRGDTRTRWSWAGGIKYYIRYKYATRDGPNALALELRWGKVARPYDPFGFTAGRVGTGP